MTKKTDSAREALRVHLLSSIDVLNEERGRIFDQIRPLQERVTKIHEELEPLKEDLDNLRLQVMKETRLDWAELLECVNDDTRSSMVIYRFFGNEVYERFSMWHSGRWADTKDAIIHIQVRDDDASERKNQLGVRHFVKFLKPQLNGKIWFAVFSNDLSGSSLRLEVSPDCTDCALVGRFHAHKPLGGIKEALSYIRKNHFYGSRAGYDDDE